MKYTPHHPIKRFILTGEVAKIFRSIFDSYSTPGSEEEQSVLITCAMGTVITDDQLERIEARLKERNTFLSRYKWEISRCFEKGNDMDEYDEDGVLISLYDNDEYRDNDDDTELDNTEFDNAKEVLARIFHDEGVKPMELPNGKLGYRSEPDGGKRMEALRGGWAFNAKFIVSHKYIWKAPMWDCDDFSILAKYFHEKFGLRHDSRNPELYNWDWEEYTLFPLPENLNKEEK